MARTFVADDLNEKEEKTYDISWKRGETSRKDRPLGSSETHRALLKQGAHVAAGSCSDLVHCKSFGSMCKEL